jgi:hypothetical protein
MPRTNHWNRLEELKFTSGIRVDAVSLYENAISKFRSIEGWLKEINYNIRVKKGCPLSPTPFGIYIDKLEYYLEVVGFVGPNIASIVIILLLYVDDISCRVFVNKTQIYPYNYYFDPQTYMNQ